MFNFGTRLKGLRESRKITQQDLADLMGLSRATIAGYETSGKQPDQEKTIWLAKYFKVSTDYLLGVTEDPTPFRNVDQDLTNEQDIESQWHAFLESVADEDFMLYKNRKFTDEEKKGIIEDDRKRQLKKQEKVNRFLDFPDEIIDDAYLFAKYANEKRNSDDE